MENKVKAVIIRRKLKPIFVAQIVELTFEELFALQKEADENLEELEGSYKTTISDLKKENQKLKEDIKYLKGE